MTAVHLIRNQSFFIFLRYFFQSQKFRIKPFNIGCVINKLGALTTDLPMKLEICVFNYSLSLSSNPNNLDLNSQTLDHATKKFGSQITELSILFLLLKIVYSITFIQ
jgi:hypothetical protein